MTVYRIALIALLTLGTGAVAQERDHIAITDQQVTDLGITTQTPARAQEIPLTQAAARVTIPPANEYVVSAARSGLVETVTVALGEAVKKGQPVARINSPELLNLQRDLLNDASALKLSRATLKRDEALHREGIIAQKRRQESASMHQQKVATFNEAQQLLLIAGMSPRDIDQLLRKRRLSGLMTVRAPITGVIIDKSVTAGQRVDAQTPLFRVANLDKLWLDISVPQAHIDAVKVDDSVTIEGGSHRARIFLIGQSVDPVNQSVLARAAIEHDSQSQSPLRPGQKVTVQLSQRIQGERFKVPVSAVIHSEGKSYLFITSDGGFAVREVVIAGRDVSGITLSEGLHPGERVVVTGVAALKASWMGIGGGEE